MQPLKRQIVTDSSQDVGTPRLRGRRGRGMQGNLGQSFMEVSREVKQVPMGWGESFQPLLA